MTTLARSAYRSLLYLHPREFRAEFGDEMLQIFDEYTNHVDGGRARLAIQVGLFCDIVRSAFVQHILREPPTLKTVTAYFYRIHSSDVLFQAAQVGFLVFCCLFNILSIVFGLRLTLSGR